MRNIEAIIHVKLEVKVSIKIFLRSIPLPPFHPTPSQKFRPLQKNLTHGKNFDLLKRRKNYDPRKKNLTHVTHVKI